MRARASVVGYAAIMMFGVLAGDALFSAQIETDHASEDVRRDGEEASRPGASGGTVPVRTRDEVHRDVKRQGRRLGQFRPSFFQTVDEADELYQHKPRRVSVHDREGRTITKVSREFYRRMCTEGAGRLVDGRILTYDTRVRGEIRFRATDAPYGLSHLETPLVPYRSVAVDRRVVSLGSVLYVPALDGIILADSTVHDGIVFADDVGSAVVGKRIDFFVGFDDHLRNTLSQSRRIRHAQPIEVYLVPGGTGP